MLGEKLTSESGWGGNFNSSLANCCTSGRHQLKRGPGHKAPPYDSYTLLSHWELQADVPR